MIDRVRVRASVRRLPLACWLALVWVLLWGTLDAGTVLFGIAVALLVAFVFPVPPVATRLVARPLGLLRLIGYLAVDLVVSTVRVAWQAVREGPRVRAGIVAVRLRTDSDHLTAMVANGVSLAPGNFVLQVDRANRICYVYSLGMDAESAADVRGEVLDMETRVVRAVGSREAIELVNAVHPGEVRR